MTVVGSFWDSHHVAGGGERHALYADHDAPRAEVTVVRLPGTAFRLYWPDGDTTDAPTRVQVNVLLASHFGDNYVPPLPELTRPHKRLPAGVR